MTFNKLLLAKICIRVMRRHEETGCTKRAPLSVYHYVAERRENALSIKTS